MLCNGREGGRAGARDAGVREGGERVREGFIGGWGFGGGWVALGEVGVWVGLWVGLLGSGGLDWVGERLIWGGGGLSGWVN